MKKRIKRLCALWMLRLDLFCSALKSYPLKASLVQEARKSGATVPVKIPTACHTEETVRVFMENLKEGTEQIAVWFGLVAVVSGPFQPERGVSVALCGFRI